jgi:hypothetical protein
VEREADLDELVQIHSGGISTSIAWQRDPVHGNIIGFTEASIHHLDV